VVVYDELYISTMREIHVCRMKIEKMTAMIKDMERKYNLKTAEFIERFDEGGMRDSEDYTAWHDSYEGLKNWEERLREFHEILEKNR
jgi:hypothetical protein